MQILKYYIDYNKLYIQYQIIDKNYVAINTEYDDVCYVSKGIEFLNKIDELANFIADDFDKDIIIKLHNKIIDFKYLLDLYVYKCLTKI